MCNYKKTYNCKKASSTVEDEKEKNTIGGDPKIWAPIVRKSQRRQLGRKMKRENILPQKKLQESGWLVTFVGRRTCLFVCTFNDGQSQRGGLVRNSSIPAFRSLAA